MSSKEQEYKELFLAEAFENYEQLEKLFTDLEKDISNRAVVDTIFRITHTLKGNAKGMGFDAIADLCHVIEDVFGKVKTGEILLDVELFNMLFRAVDKLGELINAVKEDDGKTVFYKGILTKLKVFLKKNTQATETGSKSEEKTAEIIPEVMVEPQLETYQQISEGVAITELETTKIAFSDSIQVSVNKLDALMNLVGELIIERDSLIARSSQRGNEFFRLQRITSDLQYGVMNIRLVQIGFLFQKFHRILRDVAKIEQKKVNLSLEGTDIEIDRNVLKIISDSLVHLVRNAVSHGIESPEEREKAGKAKEGKVILRASNEKDTVILQVIDDGKGIDVGVIRKKALKQGIITEEYAQKASDKEIMMCIFEAGFSNAEKITEISGRGVGMDVVKKAINSTGGKVDVSSTLGQGTTITMYLPLSMAVKGALLFVLGGQEYAVALSYTEAVISLHKKDIHKVSEGLVASYLDKPISVLFLKDIFSLHHLSQEDIKGKFHQSFDEMADNDKLELLIVNHQHRTVGIVVDKLLQQKEIVEKKLYKPLDKVQLFSGATILGNGNVCMVLNIPSILNRLFKE